MFFFVVLTIWTLMHFYVALRLLSAFQFRHSQGRYAVIGIFAFLWASFILSHRYEESLSSQELRFVSILGADWVGVLFLGFVCLLAVDVATGFGYLLPRITAPARKWALLASAVLSIIALIQGLRAPAVREYEVTLEQLPSALDKTTVLVASDFHLGAILGKPWLSRRVTEINNQHPSIVILAGDIVEGHGAASAELIADFKRLSAPLGIWAVNGNHERYGRSSSLLEGAGIHVLKDEWKQVCPGLVVAGVDDLSERNRRASSPLDSVRKALSGIPHNSAIVFVSHSPVLSEAAADMHAGLMVSGHTHNGQIWPFNYIVRFIYPRIAGKFDINGMPLIVCRGTGTWGPQMRLWSRGEVTKITLRTPASPSAGRIIPSRVGHPSSRTAMNNAPKITTVIARSPT